MTSAARAIYQEHGLGGLYRCADTNRALHLLYAPQHQPNLAVNMAIMQIAWKRKVCLLLQQCLFAFKYLLSPSAQSLQLLLLL
jgi:hypothetical protein